MPTFIVTGPDGRKYRVTGPEGSTAEQALAQVQAKVAAQPQDKYDPTGSFLENLAAGSGGAIVGVGRRVRQLAAMAGLGDEKKIQAEIDEAKKLDAPLGQTWGGNIGNIGTQIGMALGPGALLKGAAAIPALARAAPALTRAGQATIAPTTIPGAAAVGGAQGFMQPVASDESGGWNTVIGMAGGAAIPTAAAATGVVRHALRPFYGKGQERVAGDALQRIATDPSTIQRATGAQLVPGSVPTLAAETGDIGLAQLQRTLRLNPDANAPITARLAANKEAQLGALREIAGNPADRQAWVEAREAVAKLNYGKAFGEMPTTTPWIKGQLTRLQARPAFRSAFEEAKNLAAEEGLKLDPKNVVQVLHYTKMALDDAIGGASAAGNKQKAAAIIGTRDQLVSLLESKDFAPSYAAARETYKDMSKAINQMDVGQELVNKFQPALADFGATSRTTAASYGTAMRNADVTAQRATGFGGARMADVLGPQQMQTVTNIAHDLGRATNAEELGRAGGSPTAQNLISQDLLGSVLGPFGIPKAALSNAAVQSFMRPMSFLYQIPEGRVLKLLGEAMADPEKAKKLLEEARKKRGLLGRHTDDLLPYAAPLAAGGLLNFPQ